MKIPEEGKLIRIFIGESDRFKGKPLHEAILHLAKTEGLAGCTVIKGFEGFGAASRIHTAKILRLSEDLPVVIEIIDTEEKIDRFLPKLDSMVQEGLVTVEKVKVVLYRHDPSKKS